MNTIYTLISIYQLVWISFEITSKEFVPTFGASPKTIHEEGDFRLSFS